MTIIDQKAHAANILKLLKRIDPRCILAGGAPRDWYLNQLATDLDFYVYMPTMQGAAFCGRQLEEVLGAPVTMAGSEDILYEENKLAWVFNAQIGEKTPPIQIMVWKEATFSVVGTFIVSISRFWAQDGFMVLGPEGVHAIETGVIRYKRQDLGSKGHNYIVKIMNKFPNYQFVEYPEE